MRKRIRMESKVAQLKCHEAVAEQSRATIAVARESAPNLVSRRNSD